MLNKNTTIAFKDTKGIFGHPLIAFLRKIVKNKTLEMQLNSSIDLCDLIQNVLFRLTTIPIKELFLNSDLLYNYIVTTYKKFNWMLWPEIPTKLVWELHTDEDLLEKIILEQYRIIQTYSTNNLLANLIDESLIDNYRDCKIKKICGKYHLVSNLSSRIRCKLKFQEIDLSWSKKIHSSFHYIHQPRGSISFGLFIVGAHAPFSVVSVSKIDREYKVEALALKGYCSNTFLEISRLYNLPDSPKNTSSVVLSSTSNLLSKRDNTVQGFLTTHAPSFATSNSMVSGGFEDILLAKECNKRFAPKRTFHGTDWVHVVQRKENYKCKNYIQSLPEYYLIPELVLIRKSKCNRYKSKFYS